MKSPVPTLFQQKFYGLHHTTQSCIEDMGKVVHPTLTIDTTRSRLNDKKWGWKTYGLLHSAEMDLFRRYCDYILPHLIIHVEYRHDPKVSVSVEGLSNQSKCTWCVVHYIDVAISLNPTVNLFAYPMSPSVLLTPFYVQPSLLADANDPLWDQYEILFTEKRAKLATKMSEILHSDNPEKKLTFFEETIQNSAILFDRRTLPSYNR